MIDLNFTLNGKILQLTLPDEMRLLDILRDKLRLTGTKEGCAIGECGACTVLINDKAVCSCITLACQIQNASIETIEFAENDLILSTLQQAFLKTGAVQCGFCTPGMIMSSKALLLENPQPGIEDIKIALSGNLCRCTGYTQIIEAVQLAAAILSHKK
jgi:aerobic carbon-monoxide dehydrogenase small subunit